MKLKTVILLFLFSLTSFSQNQQLLREEAINYYEEGNFSKARELFNKINNKNIVENTNINLYKLSIQNIINHEFFNKIKLNDSIYKIYIKANVLKTQGIFNTKTNQYTILPIYDSIVAAPNYYQKYIKAYKNNLTSLINVETGKSIIPLGNYTIGFDSKYIYTNTKKKYDTYSENGLTNVYDINGNLLLNDLNTFQFIYPKYYSTKNKNNKYQIIDFETKEILIDDCDFYNIPTTSIVENEILFENNWISFSKNNKLYLYKVTKDTIENTNKFDTFVYLHSNYNYFETTLTSIINQKETAIKQIENEQIKCCWSHYTIVKKGAKYGVFNVSKDCYYKEPIYDSITEIGNTFYNGKWINLIYDEEICAPKTKHYEAFLFKKNNLFGLLNFSGKIIVEAKYDEIKSGYNNTYYLRKGTKWGFIGTNKNDLLVDPKFDFISGNSGNLIGYKNKKLIQFSSNGIKLKPKTVDKKQPNKEYIYQANANLYDSEKIETNRQIFKKNGKFGLDDLNHIEIIPETYSSIKAITKDRFLVSLDTLNGVIDENGKILIPIKQSRIDQVYDANVLDITNKKGLHAIYNFDGTMLYPFNLQQITDSRTYNNTTYYIAPEVLDTSKYKYNEYSNYPKIILKLKDNKVEKLNIKGVYVNFLSGKYIVFGDTNLKSFYNINTEKYTNPEYLNFIDDYQNNRILAQKGNYYDTLIDDFGKETKLEHPFFETMNGYYYFKENDRINVMDKDFKVANFNDPILKNLVEYNTYSNSYSFEYRKIASSLFKFNTDITSKKYGIINFDGTIIFQPNKYDEISFINFESDYFRNFKSNPNYKNLVDNLFIASNTKNDISAIKLITFKNEIIADFEIKKNETWKFCSYNDGILIKSIDSIKQYNFKTKKIDLKLKAKEIQENNDNGFTVITNLDEKFLKTSYKKYTSSGLFILDSILDTKNRYYCHLDYENYIVSQNNKYGTINSKNKPGIPFIYQSLHSKNGQLFIAKKENLYGVIDANNQIILDRKYQDIKWTESKKPYSNELLFSLFTVKENNKWGIINLNAKTILPTNFDSVKVQYDNLMAKKDSIVSVYDHTGILKFTAVVDSIKYNFNNYNLYKNGKEVFRNKNGIIVDKNPYISWEEETKLNYSKQIDSKFYLSKKDTIVYKNPISSIEEVDATNDSFIEDKELLIIQDESNLKGLYTKNIEEILPIEYTEINLIKNEDYIIVRKNNKFGVVNFKNKILIPLEYDQIQFNTKDYFECTNNDKTINKTPQNKIIYNLKKQKPAIIYPD